MSGMTEKERERERSYSYLNWLVRDAISDLSRGVTLSKTGHELAREFVERSRRIEAELKVYETRCTPTNVQGS